MSQRGDHEQAWSPLFCLFIKGKNQNYLGEENLNRIFEAYKKREAEDKLSSLVSMDEIKENDYNLNIPRYVDISEEEEPIDLAEVNREIEAHVSKIRELTEQIEEQILQLHPYEKV